jgi:acetate kinase
VGRPEEIPAVLALNCGSSSLKFGLFRMVGEAAEPLIAGEADAIGSPQGRFSARAGDRDLVSEAGAIASHADALGRVFALLDEQRAPAPRAVGHRIVHGGPAVRRHCLITPQVLAELEAARVFAPLHAPAALEVIRAAQARFAAVPQAACLDTAFHRDLPQVARRFPIARPLQAGGVERYGFHGLSCESVLRQLGAAAPERIVVAHLGSGSSVTAIRDGRSIDTSMGLTPSGGVMMATRSGDLDPGLLVYLIRQHGLDADALEVAIDREAGMAGVSGLSGDMRRLRAAAENPDAELAVRMFVYSVRKQIAAMAAALEGLDLVVFTGGIGENDAPTRDEIGAGLAWLGSMAIRALPAKEEEQLARHAWALAAANERRRSG